MSQVKRIVPAWTYRPGPDVSDVPPPGLVKAPLEPSAYYTNAYIAE